MGDAIGFMKYDRVEVGHRPVAERVRDYREIDLPLVEPQLLRQATRCMDCGVPFCHSAGCPVFNRIPEFNELISRGKWHEASRNLHSTNNFPEITGRICPAPCEAACTLNVNSQPVSIKQIEYQIAERAFAERWIQPIPATRRSGKRIAIVGSGPAGLAAAQQLARAGHDVHVFEKDERVGGLLRYGIPDFKLDKRILDRRLRQLAAEGVKFETGVEAGRDLSVRYFRKTFQAILLTMGAGEPRPLVVPGAGFENIHFAMDFLTQQNRLNANDVDAARGGRLISTQDKIVVVIGGGDTGSDCVGTAIRQGARAVHQLEILPRPPEGRNPATPWPLWPQILRTSTSHEEGCHRRWSVLTKGFSGAEVRVTTLHGCEIEWAPGPRGWQMQEKPGTDFSMAVDLVLLAMGFVHVRHEGLVKEFGLDLDPRGNVIAKDYMTSEPGVFAAGDTTLGASLVVRAIHAGREAAASIDRWLTQR